MTIRRILCNAVILLFFFSLPVHADDDYSIEVIVEKGDSLYKICEKILEDPEDWRRVAMVNRIKNPNLISPGQKLIIPTRLLLGVPVDGVITFVKGDAQIQLKGTEEWNGLQQDDLIAQGDRIRTGARGAIEITFENDFTIFLRPDTTIEITAARKKSAAFLVYKLFIDIGRTISKIKRSTGKEIRFEIRTPSAVAAARGTQFRAGVDAAVTSRLEVLSGKVVVQAAKKEVEVTEGQGTSVKKGFAPSIPKKLLPPPRPMKLQPIYREMPLDFQFEGVSGATSYRILLARDNTFKDVLINKVIQPDRSFTIDKIKDGTYYLQSRSIDKLGLEGPSFEPEEIRVRTSPLPPYIQSPIDGTEFREKIARFKWLKAHQAVRYHLQVAEDPVFNTIIVDEKNITGVAHKTTELDYKTYYFRVSSVANDDYEGIWSDVQRFTIIPPPPSPPVEKPEVSDKELRIRWLNQGDGFTYHLQIAKDKAFQDVILDKMLMKPEVTLEKPDKGGTYFVRTSVIDPQGYEGDFSNPQSFEIERKHSYLPAVVVTLICLFIVIL